MLSSGLGKWVRNIMKNYRYDLITAGLDCGIHEHPQVQMKKLGAKVIRCEPVPIGDCWWFRTENEIIPTPKYLTEMSDDFKFTGEDEVVERYLC